jgi:hypothetical protein
MGSWLVQVTLLALGCKLTCIYAGNSDRGCHLDALFYLMFSVVQNFALPFWKQSAFEYRIEISEILNCFMLTLIVATALPLDALRQPMASVAIAVHSIVGQF